MNGFHDLMKIFLPLDEGIVHLYINIISKKQENLKHLDLDTRIMAIREKALKKASKIEESSDTMYVRVNRKCVFDGSFKSLCKFQPHQILQGEFEVKFLKEEGIDSRGLTREWFSCLSKEIFDPKRGLFKLSGNKLTV